MNKPRLLMTGADGFVGSSIALLLAEYFELIEAPPYDEVTDTGLDLSDKSAAHQLVRDAGPDVILHLAAMKNVGRCEREPEQAFLVNVGSTKNLLSARIGHVVLLSSDYVFDGQRGQYTDLDFTCPATVYGRTKNQAELLALQAGGTVVRSSGLFGPPSRPGVLFSWAIEQLTQGQSIEAFTNVSNTPTYVHDLALALAHICQRPPGGIYHAVGSERLSRFELLRLLANALDADENLIRPGSCPEQFGTGLSPSDLSLVCSHRSPLDSVQLRAPTRILSTWSQSELLVRSAS